jgi:hypothetical protein
MAEPSNFEDAERRINEIAEVTQLAISPSDSDHTSVPGARAWDPSKSKGQSIIELRKLCGKHRTVPTSYKLEGVEKEGECARKRSPRRPKFGRAGTRVRR